MSKPYCKPLTKKLYLKNIVNENIFSLEYQDRLGTRLAEKGGPNNKEKKQVPKNKLRIPSLL